MKIFISKKTIKLPRYKLIYILILICFFIIILINTLLNIYFKNISNEEIINYFLHASLEGDNYYKLDKIILKNIFGIEIHDSQTTSQNNENIEEIVIEEPIIYIYNTFQTDKYKSNYYNSYSINPLITQASLIFKEYLEDQNIPTIVETQSVAKILKENNISYTNSYKGSKILLEEAQAQNPTLQYFIDIQLSDYDYNTTTTYIEDKSYAKILFVIGTDNSNYDKNQELAQKLNAILETKEPNLSRGISLRGGSGYQGVYNQDFSSTTLLIQVGGVENTIEEVNRSLKILALVFKEYLQEEKINESK